MHYGPSIGENFSDWSARYSKVYEKNWLTSRMILALSYYSNIRTQRTHRIFTLFWLKWTRRFPLQEKPRKAKILLRKRHFTLNPRLQCLHYTIQEDHSVDTFVSELNRFCSRFQFNFPNKNQLRCLMFVCAPADSPPRQGGWYWCL